MNSKTRLPVWRRPVGRWTSAAALLALTLCVAWLALNVRIGVVTGESMEPTLMRGDWYAMRVDAYRRSSPQRGDIVVIAHPEGHEMLVKRVVGLGGERIGVLMGRVWINGTLLDEPYLKEPIGVREFPILIDIPKDHLFVMGDNRNHSEDSRDLGPLPADAVVGKVVAVIYPFARRRPIGNPFAVTDSPHASGAKAGPDRSAGG